MKEKIKKIIVIILIIISIINIICLIYGFFSCLADRHSYFSSTNITIFSPVILILQIVSIILLTSILRKEQNTKKQRIKLFCVIAIIIITLFIPVKGTYSIKYTYNRNNNNLNPTNPLVDSDSTTYINSYKNLYGLTLENDEKTYPGITIID